MRSLEFTLRPVPPFRLSLVAWALRRRPDNLVDRWDGATYRRVAVLNGRLVHLAVAQQGTVSRPRLDVGLHGPSLRARDREQAAALVDRMLGLRVDLSPFYRLARSHPRIGPLAERFVGFKPPRYPTLFEALINAITCQQFTLTSGIRMLNRLVAASGLRIVEGGELLYAFPRPQDLLRVAPARMRGFGLNRQKARSMRDLARRLWQGRLDLESVERMEASHAVEFLTALDGVGPWSAEYALLRGAGRIDIFPTADVGAYNHLARFLGRRSSMSANSVRRLLAPFAPYGGILYFLMLLDGLAQAGALDAPVHGSRPPKMSAEKFVALRIDV